MSLVAFSVLRAAMFAEPAVTQIEEVRGLMHLEISDDKSQISNQTTENLTPEADFRSQVPDLKPNLSPRAW